MDQLWWIPALQRPQSEMVIESLMYPFTEIRACSLCKWRWCSILYWSLINQNFWGEMVTQELLLWSLEQGIMQEKDNNRFWETDRAIFLSLLPIIPQIPVPSIGLGDPWFLLEKSWIQIWVLMWFSYVSAWLLRDKVLHSRILCTEY